MSNIDEHGSDTEDSNTGDVLNQTIMPNINKGTNKIDKKIKRSWINKDKKEEKTKKMTVKSKKNNKKQLKPLIK